MSNKVAEHAVVGFDRVESELPLQFRVANAQDIPGMTAVRFSVQENRLSDPGWLTQQIWLEALEASGNACTWVCESEGRVVGFSTGRIAERDIWALFVDPEFEGRGIGSKLLTLAMEWMVGKGVDAIELSTTEHTRADSFYQRKGWQRGELNARREVVYQWNGNPSGHESGFDQRKS